MIVFIWLFCLIGRGKSLNNSQTSISWDPLEPLLFNKDVILKCFIKDCCPEGTQWTGGKSNSLLTLGRVSNNKVKYEESWGVDASYLKIQKFGIDDGDSLYTCFHGFSKYSKNLTINGNKFALMPTEETLKKNVTLRKGYLNADVEFLKVYPEPVCDCTFQKLGITDLEHINVSSDFYPTTSLFLNGKLHIAHQICHECLGTIKIDCRIGIHAYKVFESMVDIQSECRNETKDTEQCIIYAYVIVGITVFAVILAFILVKLRRKFKDRKKSSKLESKESAVVMNTQSENTYFEVIGKEPETEDASVDNGSADRKKSSKLESKESAVLMNTQSENTYFEVIREEPETEDLSVGNGSAVRF